MKLKTIHLHQLTIDEAQRRWLIKMFTNSPNPQTEFYSDKEMRLKFWHALTDANADKGGE